MAYDTYLKTGKFRYKYREYWISIEKQKNDKYNLKTWICGHPEEKEETKNILALSQAQAIAENKIDKILSIGGILS